VPGNPEFTGCRRCNAMSHAVNACPLVLQEKAAREKEKELEAKLKAERDKP